MESQPFIIFSLNGLLYGIQAFCVQEIFFLPELTQVAQMLPSIVGVLNLRGKILPVIDLNLHLGSPPLSYHLTDSIIVLAGDNISVGIIVNQVHSVKTIAANAITLDFFYGQPIFSTSVQFVSGIAKLDSDLIMLLNHELLMHYPALIEAEGRENESRQEDNFFTSLSYQLHPTSRTSTHVFSNASPEEQAIFRERAVALMQPSQSQDFTNLLPLAVIGLNNEYFGLELALVREFTAASKITVIPCCPVYISGNINLRGEIVTLVDIRTILNLPATTTASLKVMVVQIDDLIVGIRVDDVFDVIYLEKQEMTSLPTASRSFEQEYLQGTARYKDKMMSILDLRRILASGKLMVEQEV